MIPADPDRVVAAARHWRGTPYHDQASRRGVGCDCLGLVRGVWAALEGHEPEPVPAYPRMEARGDEILRDAGSLKLAEAQANAPVELTPTFETDDADATDEEA